MFADFVFRAFTIFNVGEDAIPFDDFSASVTQRNVAAPEPAIRPVRLAQALLILDRLPGRQCRLEFLDGSGNIVGMGSGHPTPVQPLLSGKAQIIQKTLTYEINR